MTAIQVTVRICRVSSFALTICETYIRNIDYKTFTVTSKINNVSNCSFIWGRYFILWGRENERVPRNGETDSPVLPTQYRRCNTGIQ